MTERYELKSPRTGSDGKTYFTKCGVAYPWKNNQGFNLLLEALPVGQLNEKGQLEVRLIMTPPYEKPLSDAPSNNSDNNPFV
jgi:hypothetical protein